jgi:hypothetical protein
MSGMALSVGMLVVAGIAVEPSVKDKPSNNTNPHTYSYACTDVAYCCTNTYTDSYSDPKCEGPQVTGDTPLGFLVAGFLFHCIYSLDCLMILASWQSAPPNASRRCLLVRQVIEYLLQAILILPESSSALLGEADGGVWFLTFECLVDCDVACFFQLG